MINEEIINNIIKDLKEYKQYDMFEYEICSDLLLNILVEYKTFKFTKPSLLTKISSLICLSIIKH